MRAVTPSCVSLAALAAALVAASPAAAQRSFQGDGQVVFGSATISQGNGTVVTVSSPQSVINWTPNGSGDPAVFQPAGTSALFTTQAGSGLTDFAVLNRILPANMSQPIQLNGTILSRLQGDAGRAAGTVYFYTPGGIVIGAGAVIDVGSLGLTTSDPWSGSGPWIGADRTVRFAPSLPGRGVTVQPGASLSSSGSTGSYTAIVAPFVAHRGSIRSSGGAALVAADSATITFSPDNLYTIQVAAGSAGDPGGLVIDGGSVARAAAGPVAAGQRLYLVSIPKNAALTMLIQGGADLGFTPATQASIEGNAVVLSAGRDIDRGALGASSNGLQGNAVIQNATLRDAAVAGINGAANLLALSGDLAFAGDLAVQSGAVTLRAENGHALTVGGALLADARGGPVTDASGIGGTIDLVAGRAGSTRGGTVSIGGGATLLADGLAGGGGNGRGGAVSLLAAGQGTLSIGGALTASADGIGGAGAAGGAGQGGSVRLAAASGTLRLLTTSAHASGVGGAGSSGRGGEARGGSLALEASGGGALQIGSFDGRADATGGGASNERGGDAAVGGLTVTVAGGSLTGDNVALAASARGGTGSSVPGRSTTLGGNAIVLSGGGRVALGDLTLAIDAGTTAPGAIRDLVSIDGATALVRNRFGLVTAGPLGVVNSGGLLDAPLITLRAATFVAEAAPLTAGTLRASSWDIASRGDVVIGGNIAANALTIDAPGRVALGSIASTGDVLIRAGGPLSVGDVSASRLLLASGSTLGAGNLAAPAAVALLADGAVSTRALNAAGGTIVVGDDGMLPGSTALDRVDWAALIAAAPVATRGSLLIDGPVTAARLSSAAGGDARFTGTVSGGQALTFSAGGLLSLDGVWNAPAITLTSSDLALGAAASLTAGGDLRLISSNAAQLLLGDGLSGIGYALSNGEFARLRGGNITITGRSDASVTPAIAIGRLTLTGSQLGATGTLRIATAAPNGRAGVIQVAGLLGGAALGPGQTVELEAGRIEVDASRGAINLAGSNGLPGGQLNLRADRLWVGDPAILARLAANAAYAGRERDLAQPSATPHPEGIIRAGTVRLFDARQILVQNSGTRTTPAGVTTSNGAFLAFTAASGGPIELIANGQIIGPNGTTISGFAVQSALTNTEGFRSLVFTPNSSINGCLVGAPSCAPNVIRDEDIDLGSFKMLPDRLFGDDDGEADDKKAKSSAIQPAERLVDRKPLDRTQPVDEPVSGTGNPALAGGPAGGGQ